MQDKKMKPKNDQNDTPNTNTQPSGWKAFEKGIVSEEQETKISWRTQQDQILVNYNGTERIIGWRLNENTVILINTQYDSSEGGKETFNLCAKVGCKKEQLFAQVAIYGNHALCANRHSWTPKQATALKAIAEVATKVNIPIYFQHLLELVQNYKKPTQAWDYAVGD